LAVSGSHSDPGSMNTSGSQVTQLALPTNTVCPVCAQKALRCNALSHSVTRVASRAPKRTVEYSVSWLSIGPSKNPPKTTEPCTRSGPGLHAE
jgi:hypothetical protein